MVRLNRKVALITRCWDWHRSRDGAGHGSERGKGCRGRTQRRSRRTDGADNFTGRWSLHCDHDRHEPGSGYGKQSTLPCGTTAACTFCTTMPEDRRLLTTRWSKHRSRNSGVRSALTSSVGYLGPLRYPGDHRLWWGLGDQHALECQLMGVAGLDCYTAAKGGIAAITRSMAVEFAPRKCVSMR